MKQKYLDGITITKENRDKVRQKIINKCIKDPNLKIQYFNYDEFMKKSSWEDVGTDFRCIIGSTYRLAYLTDEEKAMKYEKPELLKSMHELFYELNQNQKLNDIKERFPNWLIKLDYITYYNPNYDENDPNYEN